MRRSCIIILLSILVQLSWAQKKVVMNEWLYTTPQKINLPAFSDIKNIDGKTFKLANLLNSTNVDFNNTSLTWNTIKIDSDSIVINKKGSLTSP